MKTKIAIRITILTALSHIATAQAQEGAAAKGKADQAPKLEAVTIESINDAYHKDILAVERKRLEQFGKLAASQPKGQAALTYSAFFSLAIKNGLYAEAEPVAEAIIRSKDTPANVAWMAHLVNIIAEADKGQFEDSLRSLGAAIRLKSKEPKPADDSAALSVGTRASILDAYYQRLVREDQFDLARRAMKLIVDNTDVPAIRELAEGRLKQLDLVGRPAPAIKGINVDRKPFVLEAGKGDVVLVVFWATWCVPSAQEIPWLDEVSRRYGDRGLRIVGVNVDAPAGAAQDAAMPNIRRYLLDLNVPWTNLLNGKDDADIAKAFGVREIPANVLIGRDGTVVNLDVYGYRLDRAIAKAIKVAK